MPTTRRQAVHEVHKVEGDDEDKKDSTVGDKRHVDDVEDVKEKVDAEPPAKKNKAEDVEKEESISRHARQTGTIERGHIYFFYRPRVQHEEAHSIDDVQKLHMLLVPRPPKFSAHDEDKPKSKMDKDDEDVDMTVLREGADAIPAKATLDTPEKRYRLITIGKKELPDPEVKSRRGRVFWAAVTAVGNDLHSLEKGLGEKTYETKTRGTRHQEPARLAARGVYAIVNNEPSVPSKRETHLGFYISHPEEMGDVQVSLGIHKANSFVLQVKNPLAPNTGAQRTLSPSKRAKYPDGILDSVFGKGTKGRESYGLRFASCETIDLLDYEGAELLLIAARSGKEGLEASLGEGRGEALEEVEESEGSESIDQVFRELALNKDEFPQEALQGKWI